jgi:hypothetical protein
MLAAFLVLHCSPSEEDMVQRWTCPGEDLTAGLYSFSVDELEDNCGVGQIDDSILGRYNPMLLPDFRDLPAQTTMDMPLVGTQVVQLSVKGGTVQFTLADEEEAVVDLGDCQLRFSVTGVVCPAMADDIDVQMKFTFLGATELVPGACEEFSFPEGCTVTPGSECLLCP